MRYRQRMSVQPILQLGTPSLFEPCQALTAGDVPRLSAQVQDLHDTMRAFQAEHGWGRAIAAPQIGVPWRIVAMRVGGDAPQTFYNPVLDDHDHDQMEYWEDCMSFPNLLVRVRMPKACRLTYRDAEWREHRVWLTGDYAALLQHEVDHLDGVLATQRAIDERSLALRSTQPPKNLAWQGEFQRLT
ncbi:MAG: peptide deformylase [Pseudomonadota bacterium]